MIGSGIVRPRVLVADGDAERRARTRRALGDEFVLAEAAAADEALVWLEDHARGAGRRHEREAAARLSKPELVAAWKAVDAAARERWLHDYLQAVESPAGSPDREKCLQELAYEVGAQSKPGEMLTALHLHAVAAARPSTTDEAMDRARDCLVAAL